MEYRKAFVVGTKTIGVSEQHAVCALRVVSTYRIVKLSERVSCSPLPLGKGVWGMGGERSGNQMRGIGKQCIGIKVNRL